MHERAVYLNDWLDGSTETLKKHFGITAGALQRVEILLASYTKDDQRGEAFVLFRDNGILYEVNACHDAIEDLVGQWDPEDTFIQALRYRIQNGNLGTGANGENLFAAELDFLLTQLEYE